MPAFQTGNTENTKRKKNGRPRKLARTLAELVEPEMIDQFLKKTFKRAWDGDPVSAKWVLDQMPRIDVGTKLPAGLPKLDGLAGCMAALDSIGDRLRTGALSVEAGERAINVVVALGSARASLLAKFASKIDTETAAVIRQEQELKRKAPLASAPAIGPIH